MKSHQISIIFILFLILSFLLSVQNEVLTGSEALVIKTNNAKIRGLFMKGYIRLKVFLMEKQNVLRRRKNRSLGGC